MCLAMPQYFTWKDVNCINHIECVLLYKELVFVSTRSLTLKNTLNAKKIKIVSAL